MRDKICPYRVFGYATHCRDGQPYLSMYSENLPYCKAWSEDRGVCKLCEDCV